MQSLLVRNMLIYLSLSLGIVLATTDNTWPQDNEIIIHNRAHKGPLGFANKTDFDGGPVVGDILNYHYFPGLQDYKNGNYVGAARQMDYIMRNHRFILDINPRKKEYVSTAYYLHGRIYFYHASGLGRYIQAKKDFDKAIEWNPRNYPAYLELARLLSSMELRAEATSVLQRLLASQPDEQVVQLARIELTRLQSKKP